MNRLFVAGVLLGVVSVACGDSDSPTNPSSQPTTVRFTTQLQPGNEVPPVTNADASASGTTTITLNLTRDAAGAITAATADFVTTVTGFPAGTTLTGAHIHRAPAGSNAGILVGQFASGEATLTNGAGSFTKNGVSVPATAAQGMIDSPTDHYFNVHTALNPGGAIRGQLSRTQ